MSTPYDSDWSDRPTLQTARREAHLTSREVAEVAGVPLSIEYQMEIGGIVSQEDAEKILAALSRLSGVELLRIWRRGEEKDATLKAGGFHEQNATSLHQRVQAAGSRAFQNQREE